MTAYQFFLKNASYSYHPDQETKEQGQGRCAWQLADAERRAELAGISFTWEIDQDITSADWSDEEPPYEQWVCLAHDSHGNLAASLGGIDFGRDGTPWGNDYKRVAEAELAMESLEALEYQGAN